MGSFSEGKSTMINQDLWFMLLAQYIGTRSKDPSTQVGAVVVGNGYILTTGCNGLPRGAVDTVPFRNTRPEKYFWYEHAERNAVYQAARLGVSLKGATLYTVATPSLGMGVCCDCARAAIQAGIVRIVVQESDPVPGGKWEEDIRRSGEMLAECGVRLDLVDMECG